VEFLLKLRRRLQLEIDFHKSRVKKEATEISNIIEIALREQQFKYGRMNMGKKMVFFNNRFNELIEKRNLQNIRDDLFLHCNMMLYWIIDDGPEH
jgi:hypothetical protein